jgi:hypothetical protein
VLLLSLNAASFWDKSRRFRQTHGKLGYVGGGIVDCIVYDLRKKVDVLVYLPWRDGTKPS